MYYINITQITDLCRDRYLSSCRYMERENNKTTDGHVHTYNILWHPLVPVSLENPNANFLAYL